MQPPSAWSVLLAAMVGCAASPDLASTSDAAAVADDAAPAVADAAASEDAALDGGRDADDGPDAGSSPEDAAARPDAGFTSTTAAVLKPDGVTPANYRCNHRFTDGPAGPVGPQTFHVGVMTTRDRDGTRSHAADTELVLIDPVTGSTLARPSFRTDATGTVAIPVAANTRIAWKVTGDFARPCDPCVDTYEFNRLTLSSSAAATGVLESRLVEIDLFFGITPNLGDFTSPKIFGTVVDCDGDPVMNAQIDLPLCTSQGTEGPCVAYTIRGTVTTTALATNTDGRFVVLLASNGPLSVGVRGTELGSPGPVALGEATFIGFERSVSWVVATPLRR